MRGTRVKFSHEKGKKEVKEGKMLFARKVRVMLALMLALTFRAKKFEEGRRVMLNELVHSLMN